MLDSEISFLFLMNEYYIKLGDYLLKSVMNYCLGFDFNQEVRDGRVQMDNLTNQWYKDVRAAPSDSEEEDADAETAFIQ